MEKRRVRLEINGVVCGLITQESDEYMGSLADEVGRLMQEIQASSPYITREAAALTVALSFCDDARKNGAKAEELQERVDELEVEAEIMQEEQAEREQSAEPDPAMLERLQKLESENTALSEAAQQASAWREQAERLEDENAALREQAGTGGPTVQVEELQNRLDDALGQNRALQADLTAERERAGALEKALESKAETPAVAPVPSKKHLENPLRKPDIDDAHMVSFFAK